MIRVNATSLTTSLAVGPSKTTQRFRYEPMLIVYDLGILSLNSTCTQVMPLQWLRVNTYGCSSWAVSVPIERALDIFDINSDPPWTSHAW